jgi:hypothetical protein
MRGMIVAVSMHPVIWQLFAMLGAFMALFYPKLSAQSESRDYLDRCVVYSGDLSAKVMSTPIAHPGELGAGEHHSRGRVGGVKHTAPC